MSEVACRDPNGDRQAMVCRMLIRQREIVGEAFGRSLCCNPNWDMLLALYLARCEHKFIMLTALCASSHVPESTAYRRVTDLEQCGLIVRNDDPTDRRRVEIRLSDDGVMLLGSVLSRIDRFVISAGAGDA